MVKKLESILLATNLKDYNKIAFDVAVSVCTHYDAKLILLHVLEKVPIQVESLLTGLLSKEQREEIFHSYSEDVKKKLIGKSITSEIIRSSLIDYCKKTGLDPSISGYPAKEVIVCEGNVDECIISYADMNHCGMIVMAVHEGLFSKSSVSSIIKNVLRRATIPVLTVPSTC